MPFGNTIRRFSRSNSQRNSQQSDRSDRPDHQSAGAQNDPHSTYTPPNERASTGFSNGAVGASAPHAQGEATSNIHQSGMVGNPDHGINRPASQDTNSSFEYMNRPISHQGHGGMASGGSGGGGGSLVPGEAINGLSRTDQVVLRYFWEDKYADNAKRDLHFLKFPHFPSYPSHKDLLPYCEIYHLVKTSPGANIISLGSANGVYIGFELSQGAQLHIDMDDEWRDISHHRVLFKSFDTVLSDPSSVATFKSWPKPLTIEFLEEQYLRWLQDLTSFCWIDESVRELGAAAAQRQDHAAPMNATSGNGTYGSGGMSHEVDRKDGMIH